MRVEIEAGTFVARKVRNYTLYLFALSFAFRNVVPVRFTPVVTSHKTKL